MENVLLTDGQKKELQKRLRKLSRHKLVWEWMERHSNGEYVLFEDVMMMLVNFNRTSHRQAKTETASSENSLIGEI